MHSVLVTHTCLWPFTCSTVVCCHFSLHVLYAFSCFCCSCIFAIGYLSHVQCAEVFVTCHAVNTFHFSHLWYEYHLPCISQLGALHSVHASWSVKVLMFTSSSIFMLFITYFTLPTHFTWVQCFNTLALPLSTCGVKLLFIVLVLWLLLNKWF